MHLISATVRLPLTVAAAQFFSLEIQQDIPSSRTCSPHTSHHISHIPADSLFILCIPIDSFDCRYTAECDCVVCERVSCIPRASLVAACLNLCCSRHTLYIPDPHTLSTPLHSTSCWLSSEWNEGHDLIVFLCCELSLQRDTFTCACCHNIQTHIC